jgi:D-3-phosphoglycerate dehydrogenase
MPTVLIADPYDRLQPYDDERRVAAAAGADLVIGRESPPRIRDAEVILCSALPVTADMMPALTRCRLLVRYAIGVDTIDVEAATAHGIVVANAPTFCVAEVADHTAALILGLARRIPWLDGQVRAGSWQAVGSRLWGMRRMGVLTLGIIGMGKIGREVVRRMAPFGFQILGHDPHLSADAIQSLGVRPASFETVLRESDVVSLHVPLTASTRHLIDEAALRLMKPTASLVNTCRGPVVDEGALIRALREERVYGAALDVLEQEPPDADNPLLAMDPRRVILTPHCAGTSADSMVQLHREVAAAVEAVLDGRWPAATVNPQVVPKTPLRRD